MFEGGDHATGIPDQGDFIPIFRRRPFVRGDCPTRITSRTTSSLNEANMGEIPTLCVSTLGVSTDG